jgi:hypothetical protein
MGAEECQQQGDAYEAHNRPHGHVPEGVPHGDMFGNVHLAARRGVVVVRVIVSVIRHDVPQYLKIVMIVNASITNASPEQVAPRTEIAENTVKGQG